MSTLLNYPGVAVVLAIGNTEQAIRSVIDGTAELGFAEGAVADGAVDHWPRGHDRPSAPPGGTVARRAGATVGD